MKLLWGTYKMKLRDLLEGKSDYTIHHKSYTKAIDEILDFIKKNGYEVTEDEINTKITTSYPGRPSEGKTTKLTLELMKGEKVQRKALHAQVYGMKTQYELNMYIS